MSALANGDLLVLKPADEILAIFETEGIFNDTEQRTFQADRLGDKEGVASDVRQGTFTFTPDTPFVSVVDGTEDTPMIGLPATIIFSNTAP